MHITKKGQVTIPAHIRQKFGFLPKTEVNFIIKHNEVILQKIKTSSKNDFRSFLGCTTNSMSTDEIMQLTRS